MWRWPNFAPEEVLSPEGISQYRQGNLMLQGAAMDFLQGFREEVGTLFCNYQGLKYRGYRSCSENNRLETSAQYSRHTQGIAFDLSSPKHSPKELFELAKKFGWPCVLEYRNWIHVDFRTLTGEPVWQAL
jgi:hypothetical protein